MSRLINDLHRAISDVIIDPRDESAYTKCDETCQEIWQWCQMLGVTPWRYCLDRYCSCKLMLSEWEPDTLPGLPGGRAGQGVGVGWSGVPDRINR